MSLSHESETLKVWLIRRKAKKKKEKKSLTSLEVPRMRKTHRNLGCMQTNDCKILYDIYKCADLNDKE